MELFTMSPKEFLTALWGDPPPLPVTIQILPQIVSLSYQVFFALGPGPCGICRSEYIHQPGTPRARQQIPGTHTQSLQKPIFAP